MTATGHFETKASSPSKRFRARNAPEADIISTLSSRCSAAKSIRVISLRWLCRRGRAAASPDFA